MSNRHIVSISLWVVGLVLLLVMGLAASNWAAGALLLGVFLLAGIFFFRRGK